MPPIIVFLLVSHLMIATTGAPVVMVRSSAGKLQPTFTRERHWREHYTCWRGPILGHANIVFDVQTAQNKYQRDILMLSIRPRRWSIFQRDGMVNIFSDHHRIGMNGFSMVLLLWDHHP